ncbi:MAG: LPS assembly protein LptD [Candidatus Polarisedimenticolaceae bacterium]|nr:LPS assembly protein LptD [Candidatus Polarisedimenticolaceae bacterium]
MQKLAIGCLYFLSLTAWAEPISRVDRDLGEQRCDVVVVRPDPAHPIGNTEDRRLFIEADNSELERESEQSHYIGNVELHYKRTYLEADRIDHLSQQNRINATGNVYISKPGFRATSDHLQMDTQSEQAQLDQAEYRLLKKYARGHAEKIRIIDDNYSVYDQISYTTCKPGSDAWLIEADELQIDENIGLGRAYHATFYVQNLPVLYTPYISFPIDDRRMSGFLSPTIGGSDATGSDNSLSYYLNLAPNYDLILTPRHMEKRGLMLGSEFRYLSRYRHRGSIKSEYIYDDQGRESDEPIERYALSYRNHWQLSSNWDNNLFYDGISDKTYLDDFENSLFARSTRYLERRADLNYRGAYGNLLVRAQSYQTIDRSIASSSSPYTRLPQLLWTTDQHDRSLGLHYELTAELTHFQHDERIQGQRLILKPSVSLPLRRSYGHLTPKLSINYNDYLLEQLSSDQDRSPSLILPTASLDSGLVFEREIGWFGSKTTQTLEPRLFYLYTPYEEQDETPNFDSAELGFSFANLFRDNRFSGNDRIGDANQLTTALTSRILDAKSGRELLRGSIGQTHYFRDRKVQLSGTVDELRSSSIAAELSASLGAGWRTSLNLQWDPHAEKKELIQNKARLYYRGGNNKLINLSYSYNRDTISTGLGAEDVDLSFHWPLHPHFKIMGGWDYSLYHEESFERFAGFEYGGGCCWVVRTLYREYLQDIESERSSSFMIQIELRGLGMVGNPMLTFLKDNISGFIVPEAQ